MLPHKGVPLDSQGKFLSEFFLSGFTNNDLGFGFGSKDADLGFGPKDQFKRKVASGFWEKPYQPALTFFTDEKQAAKPPVKHTQK